MEIYLLAFYLVVIWVDKESGVVDRKLDSRYHQRESVQVLCNKKHYGKATDLHRQKLYRKNGFILYRTSSLSYKINIELWIATIECKHSVFFNNRQTNDYSTHGNSIVYLI